MFKSVAQLDDLSTRILTLKCTKFDFGWGSAPDSAGKTYSAARNPLTGFKGPTSKGGWRGRNDRVGAEGRKGLQGKERTGQERGGEGREGKGTGPPRVGLHPHVWNPEKILWLIERSAFIERIYIKFPKQGLKYLPPGTHCMTRGSCVCFHKRDVTTISITLWFRYNASRGHELNSVRTCVTLRTNVPSRALVSPRTVHMDDDAASVTSSTVCLRDTWRWCAAVIAG